MTTARDIMDAGATCVGEHETLTAAAQHMRDLGVGALPICGDDDHLHGMITDRDIVIKCLAAGLDPNTTAAGQLAQGSIYHVNGDADIQEMLNVMGRTPGAVPARDRQPPSGRHRQRGRHRPPPTRAPDRPVR